MPSSCWSRPHGTQYFSDELTCVGQREQAVFLPKDSPGRLGNHRFIVADFVLNLLLQECLLPGPEFCHLASVRPQAGGIWMAPAGDLVLVVGLDYE
jgi:hypothetical protein